MNYLKPIAAVCILTNTYGASADPEGLGIYLSANIILVFALLVLKD